MKTAKNYLFKLTSSEIESYNSIPTIEEAKNFTGDTIKIDGKKCCDNNKNVSWDIFRFLKKGDVYRYIRAGYKMQAIYVLMGATGVSMSVAEKIVDLYYHNNKSKLDYEDIEKALGKIKTQKKKSYIKNTDAVSFTTKKIKEQTNGREELFSTNSDHLSDIDKLVLTGDKTETIKLYREATGATPAEAKTVIENKRKPEPAYVKDYFNHVESARVAFDELNEYNARLEIFDGKNKSEYESLKRDNSILTSKFERLEHLFGLMNGHEEANEFLAKCKNAKDSLETSLMSIEKKKKRYLRIKYELDKRQGKLVGLEYLDYEDIIK